MSSARRASRSGHRSSAAQFSPFPFPLSRSRWHIYFEAAVGVTTLVLLGRYAEAWAKKSAGAALRALLDLGAKDVAVIRSGVESRVPINGLHVGDVFVVRPGGGSPPMGRCRTVGRVLARRCASPRRPRCSSAPAAVPNWVSSSAATSNDDLLAYAAAVESGSRHPIAESVVAAACDLSLPAATSLTTTDGLGVTAR